jgi:Lrp/AsnC family leucine-responsive transcriptional regulator
VHPPSHLHGRTGLFPSAAALDHFASVPEIISLYRLTGEDCFLIGIHAATAERLETLGDGIARFGPVTISPG